jgi:signal transduction histidine kinase
MSAAASPRKRGLRFWLAAFAVVTLFGLFMFSVYFTSDLAEGGRESPKVPLLAELSAAYTFFALLPLLLPFLERHPIERGTLRRRLPLHVAAFVLLAVTHTLLMWGSRTVLYRLLGWGRYDYGDMGYRFLMEGEKQAIVYALLLSGVSFMAYANRNRERELLASRLSEQLTGARLAVLKMQLNPHFLFNTLNMIAGYVDENPAVAQAMIGHLSEFLRSALRQSDVQEVPLSSELESLGAYLAITKARFEERLDVEVDAPPETLGALVPHLVLQPLVENAVVHAVGGREGMGRVSITAERNDGSLRLLVEDDGPGLGAVEPEDALRSGIGLSNTRERLERLYGDRQELSLVSLRRGLRIVLTIPFRPSTSAGSAS